MSLLLRRLLSLLLVTAASAALAAEDTDFSSGPPLDAQLNPPTRAGRVSAMEGRMQQRLPGEQRWMDAEINFPVTADMEFVTDANGRGEIQLGGATVALDGRTSVAVLELDEGKAVLHLEEGSVDLRIRNIQSGDVLTVETPDGSATLKEPGAYRIDASDRANPTRVTSFNGRAEVETSRGGVTVGSDEATEVNSDGRVRTIRAGATTLDDWAQQRENRLRTGVSSRYVSIDIPGYDDLDRIGSWETVSEYGPVWFPAKVGRDWAPYQDGKWAYVAPWGWTWIDAQPWGFAPFHFGRWVNVEGKWGWTPGKRIRRPAYVPAAVGFDGADAAQFADKDSKPRRWVALAPGEIYHAPYSQDVTYLRKLNRGVVPSDILADIGTENEELPVYANRERVRLDHINAPPKMAEDLKAKQGTHTQMVLRLPMDEARELGLLPDAAVTLPRAKLPAPPMPPIVEEELDESPAELPNTKGGKPSAAADPVKEEKLARASMKRTWDGLFPELEDRSGLVDPVLETEALPRPLVVRESLDGVKKADNGCEIVPTKPQRAEVARQKKAASQTARAATKPARAMEASMPVNPTARRQFEAQRKLQPRDDDEVESQ